MVLNSNSISLTSREPVAATWEATWSEGSKSLDSEGTRAGEEDRGQLEDDAVYEDQSQKLQELEQEKKRKEQEAQEEERRKQREAQAWAEAEAKAWAEAQARAEAEAKAWAEAQARAEAEAQKRAEAQKLQAERERETSVKIYQYRRSVPIAQRVVLNQGVSATVALFCLPCTSCLLCHLCFDQVNQIIQQSL